MNIAVIGAGIIGTTTAYELARDGHQVTVFERRIAAAEEGSFAGGGLIAPGYLGAWPGPGMPGRIVRHLLARHSPVRVKLPLAGSDLAWMWKSWRACRLQTFLNNHDRMQRLASYSQSRLHAITAELDLEFDRSSGTLVLLRSERDLATLRPILQPLRDRGVAVRELDPEQARQVEPALNPDTSFSGALHFPQDEVGNSRQFALLLKNASLERGVKFEFGTQVDRLEHGDGIALGIAGEPRPRRFDAAVVCAGAAAGQLLRPLGIRLPLAAVYGYSVSANVKEQLNAPRSAVFDERLRVSVARLGNRVRVAGTAELGGTPGRYNRAALRTLYQVLQDWFPGAALLSSGVQEWKGARPMLPDGPPVLGESGIPGLWLNLGHGSAGWTQSCGSARALADLLHGRQPDIDLSGLGMERLHGRAPG